MFKVKVLNQEVLEEVLEMKEVIEGVERVYTLKAQNPEFCNTLIHS